MKKVLAIIAVAIAIFAADIALTHTNFIKDSDYFVKNDFEITEHKHPEKVWDKVFFGNSVVIFFRVNNNDRIRKFFHFLDTA